MPRPELKQLTWSKKGVERMEFFMAEQIAFYIVEKVMNEWSDNEDSLIEELRYVRGKHLDGNESTDYLRMSIPVAGNVLGNMMAHELLELLLPPNAIAGLAEDAIQRAIKDEEYDRLHKIPEEYEIP